jgi:hypothetical protein
MTVLGARLGDTKMLCVQLIASYAAWSAKPVNMRQAAALRQGKYALRVPKGSTKAMLARLSAPCAHLARTRMNLARTTAFRATPTFGRTQLASRNASRARIHAQLVSTMLGVPEAVRVLV